MEYSNSPNDILVLYYLLLAEGVVKTRPGQLGAKT